MKLKILLAALFVAGIATALAVAAPPPGKGNPHEQGTVSTTSSTSTPPSTTTAGGKVPLCHKTGNGKFHAITVAKSAVAAHLRRGDYVGSDCSRATTTGTTSTATST